MNIIVKPFESIHTISLNDSRNNIRKTFDNIFETQENEITNSSSDFFLDSLFEVEYQNNMPVLIMVNLFEDNNVLLFNNVISEFRLIDVMSTYKKIDSEIYTDGYLVLLFNTGVGFYFDEEGGKVNQICTFKKGTNRFEKIMYNFQKL